MERGSRHDYSDRKSGHLPTGWAASHTLGASDGNVSRTLTRFAARRHHGRGTGPEFKQFQQLAPAQQFQLRESVEQLQLEVEQLVQRPEQLVQPGRWRRRLHLQLELSRWHADDDRLKGPCAGPARSGPGPAPARNGELPKHA